MFAFFFLYLFSFSFFLFLNKWIYLFRDFLSFSPYFLTFLFPFFLFLINFFIFFLSLFSFFLSFLMFFLFLSSFIHANLNSVHCTLGVRGDTDEALRYKPEGRGFDSRWCHWNFSLTQSFRPHCGPGVDSASNRNEYQEYFLGGEGGWCVGLTTLLPSCADCFEIWEPLLPGTLWACLGL